MPKSRNNNVCRTAYGDSHNYGENLEDLRSREEKVSDLTDLFIGDYHIDTDIIHAVLEECDWNVKNASEKLFEVFFSGKPSEIKKNEPEDLALIAVSILEKERTSGKQGSFSERQDGLSHGNFDLPRDGEGQTYSSIKHPKPNNTCLRQKVSSPENIAQHNYSAQSLDVKPSSESKTLFETRSGHHDFYNKNSFGDMVLNMEHSSVQKASGQNVPKGDSLPESSNNNFRFTPSPEKTKPKLDFSRLSMSDSTSLNKVENVAANSKNNSSTLYSDKSMASLISTSPTTPTISKEWDMFYRQMNLPPIQVPKTSPDVTVSRNEFQTAVKDSDIQLSLASRNDDLHSAQGKKLSGRGQENLNFTGSHQAGYKPNNQSYQIPKSASVIHGNNSPSHEKDETEEHIVRENNSRKMKEEQKPESCSLNVAALEFVPRVLDAKHPMTRKSPTKHTKSAAKMYPYNGNLLQSPERDKNSIFKKGKKVDCDQSPLLQRSVGETDNIGNPCSMGVPITYQGHREGHMSNTPKPKLQIGVKESSPHCDSWHRQIDKTNKTESHNNGKAVHSTNHVMIPPFSFDVIPHPNGNKKFTGKKRGKVPKSQDPESTHPSLPFTTGLENNSSSGGNSNTLNCPHSNPLPQRPPVLTLPPSLSRKSHFGHQHPNPVVPAPHNDSNKKDSSTSSHIVPKATSPPENVVPNKVQFVGVKTPLGKLKHYIDKKQPVMFILRGLPGSGKSYLAKQLESECQRFNIQVANLSSDVYFISSGQYVFNRQKLDEAHTWNQQRALQCLKEKQPIVIIDNTNTTLWEMMNYAEMAILHGYDIQVCEPDTQWKNKLPELARRNQHGVPRDQIKRMKDRYEILTTEDVIKEASKCLHKKNKLPAIDTPESPVRVPSLELKPQVQGHAIKGRNATPGLIDGTETDRRGDQSSPDHGLTQWIPAMEQRAMAKRSKKLLKAPSKPSEITLDFLNNSIKKALVDIEKLSDEPSAAAEEHSRGVVEEFKCEYLDSETMPNVQCKKQYEMIPYKSLVGDGDDRKEEFAPASSKDSMSDTKHVETHVTSSLASLPELFSNPQTFDVSGSTNDSFYSCVSEASHDVSEGEMEFGKSEQTRKLSETGSVESDVKEEGAIMLQDLETSESAELSNPESTSESETVVGNNDLDLFTTALISESTQKVLTSSLSVEPSTTSIDGFTNEDYAVTDSQSSRKERIMKTAVEVKDDGIGVMTINKESVVRKMTVSLPNPAASLVLYSDSEDEDETGNDMKVLDSNPEPTVCVLVDEKASDGDNVVKTLRDKDQENSLLEFDGNNQPSLTRIPVTKDHDKHDNENNHDLNDNEKSQPDSNEKLQSFDIKLEMKEISPESNSSTREESPALEDALEYNSRGKKKKKKKIKPIVPQGPFLEDSLKEKSKTENWSSFIVNLSPEKQPSPSKIIPKVTVRNASIQCEPYYFSMVYRLNSAAFTIQQPIDVSNCDVVVLQTSTKDTWEERCHKAGVSAIVQRKFETTDRSTETDETLVSEQVDLETLQSCFPEYSRKQLEDVMSICQNNMEWVTNHLLDSLPLIDVGDEDVEEENEESSQEIRNDQGSPEKTDAIKSLAQLCQDKIGNDQELDKDDFEQQVIQAGQTRLQEIEKFAWIRLRSNSRENSHHSVMCGADSWPDDFDLDHFTGGHDSPRGLKPTALFPLSESAMAGRLSAGFDEEEEDYQDMRPESNAMTIGQPVLPLHFIQCLENCFGPLNAHIDRSGLALSESTARKIYNCLKLQMSKKQVQGSDHEKQMKEDEAMARALQEAENAVKDDVTSPSPSSIPGWTNEKPAWMTSGNMPQRPPSNDSFGARKKPRSAANAPARVNSVSDTLHQLRGSWPKQLKPYKFHANMQRSQVKLQRAQSPSVWTVKSHTRHKADDMHSIMKEEKAREARLKHMLQRNKAIGDTDVLATKIKRSRLRLMFPFLPPDVLEEIFMNNGYSLETTVEVLEFQYDRKPVKVSQQMEEQDLDEILRYNDEDEGFHYLDEEVVDTVTYDDLRKEAQFRNDLANECRQKAQRYHGEGMHHAAFFYRQEVKKYLAEKDEANQKAARLLFDIGSERLLRENTLDLHSYHINEAIEAVNLAMEMKREEYHRQPERRRAYMTIITGRGRNSKGGIPRLKPAIISHLNNKGIRFEETAPGMFKVHIFQE